MPIRLQHILRETGTALAVLAIYVLVLLAPLHQAAGMQRDFSALGYESQWSWSVCTSVSDAGDTDTPTAIKCPLASAGKFDPILPPPALPAPMTLQTSIALAYVSTEPSLSLRPEGRPGKPRGPPALV